MAIGYLKKKQKINANGTSKEVYLAKVCYANYIDINILADDVSKMCSASPADVLMHVRALEDCISRRIAMGDVVKLDNLGTFYPSITATAVDSPEKVNNASIKRTGVLFRPSERFKEIVNKAGVKLADTRIFEAEPHAQKKKKKKNN